MSGNGVVLIRIVFIDSYMEDNRYIQNFSRGSGVSFIAEILDSGS